MRMSKNWTRLLPLAAFLALAGCGAAQGPPVAHTAASAPSRCHFQGSGLFVTPDPACTPGRWVDTDGLGVCHKGYNPRPPASVTEPIKREAMTAYGVPLSQTRNYELDHLYPVWLGGATVVQNLWPEPDFPPSQQPDAYTHNPKDADEFVWFKRVCEQHTATVAEARRAFEGSWVALHRSDLRT